MPGKFASVDAAKMIAAFLAVSRITRLVVDDQITEPLRDKVEGSETVPENLKYLVTCNACVSVWAALAVTFLPLPRKLIFALAMSEVTILLRMLDEMAGDGPSWQLGKVS